MNPVLRQDRRRDPEPGSGPYERRDRRLPGIESGSPLNISCAVLRTPLMVVNGVLTLAAGSPVEYPETD
jgi:hypothetical protein